MTRILVLIIIVFASQTGFAEKCTYSIAKDSLKFEWTGYKFTDKVGVTGTFNKLNLTQNDKATSMKELAKSIAISMSPKDFESNIPIRNQNIVSSLFGTNIYEPVIQGKVTRYKRKKLKVEIDILGKKRSRWFSLKTEGDNFVAESKADILNFGMKKQYEALKNVCKDLHIGPDGKSKSWSEVGLKFSGEIQKTCI